MKYKALAVSVVSALMVLGGATAAHAAGGPTEPPPVITVIDLTTTTNYVNTAKLIGRCKVGTTGATCTVAKGSSVTNTFGTALDVSVGTVTSELNMSSASTTTVEVSCTSPKLSAGESWSAYAIGTYYHYKIHVSADYGHSTQTSGYLTSFHAYSTQEYCVAS